MSQIKSPPGLECRHLYGVPGTVGLKNDIVVCGCLSTAKQHVIYFGGDVQDDKEKMMIFNAEYVEWNLEDTSRLLQKQFPDSAVIVVKPSHMYLSTFSLYRNFLLFDDEGRPEFSQNAGSWYHLVKLYKNILQQLSGVGKTTKKVTYNSSLQIVGFSKGCVVLNQLMFELKLSKSYPEIAEFLKHVQSFYWLDGGHIGRRNAYITDDDVLQNIVNLDKTIVVHVTPYQIKDTTREWIGKEEEEFVEKLQKMGAKVGEHRHFMGEKGSIQNHFKVLTKISKVAECNEDSTRNGP